MIIQDTVMIKSHLIITDIHSEYIIKWQGRIIDTNPILKNGMPIFIIISSENRIELNSCDMKQIEEAAKSITRPKGRGAVSTDTARIYIKEVSGAETYIGSVIHNRVKTYAPMFDPVGYRK